MLLKHYITRVPCLSFIHRCVPLDVLRHLLCTIPAVYHEKWGFPCGPMEALLQQDMLSRSVLRLFFHVLVWIDLDIAGRLGFGRIA